MKKKILIGSIIAIIILILVSFTGVVGYHTTKSNVRASPLFNIRTSRAIDEESKDITCDYVGKGEETSIHLSSRMKRTERVQKVISIIGKMDGKAFSKFIGRIILHLKSKEQMADTETSYVIQALHNIRENPNDKKYYDTENNPIDETVEYVSCRWFPGCYIFIIIRDIVVEIIGFIWGIFHLNTGLPMCIPPTTVVC